ncbi:hypothetical protein VNO77_43377 [Canavalia gladiata]|uniref:UDP-glycosyltransferase 87A1 n=1 Tax=Canavalia gladiata TaxID=3824 RepID=A0AAN9JW52_CANGL
MEGQVPSLTTSCHVLAVPYPSRGHINPMMNLCKLLVSKNAHILVTFVVTEQWLGLIASEPKPHNIRLASIPNVGRSTDTFAKVVEAIMTEMEAPLEVLLDRLQQPPTTMICDAFLHWAVAVANRRNIPVAAFWTTSTSELWVQYFHILQQNELCHQQMLDYIPSTSWIHRADIPLLDGNNREILQWAMKSCEWLSKAQYLLLPSIYELESQVIDALKSRLSTPIYTIGPNIPCFSVGDNSCYTKNGATNHGYLEWLDRQPFGSVLYISFGSFLSVSRAQMDEIAAALRDSNVLFMWVTRGEASRMKEICGNKGLVVAWCDQLRVLLHPSVGGYWTHCGWNSVVEGLFAGVPFLTFPIALDQPLISKLIVEDWKVGWRVKKEDKLDTLVKRDRIVVLLRKFMQLDSDVGRDLRKRAKELQHLAHHAITKDGSSETNIKDFMKNIIMQSAVSQGSNGPQVQNGIEKFN